MRLKSLGKATLSLSLCALILYENLCLQSHLILPWNFLLPNSFLSDCVILALLLHSRWFQNNLFLPFSIPAFTSLQCKIRCCQYKIPPQTLLVWILNKKLIQFHLPKLDVQLEQEVGCSQKLHWHHDSHYWQAFGFV